MYGKLFVLATIFALGLISLHTQIGTEGRLLVIDAQMY